MIPGVMVDFLGRASVAAMGTRDASLVPHLHWLAGWSVGEDRRTITCLVQRGYTDDLLPSLEDNGRVSMTAEVIGPHETYQFKGRWLDCREVTPTDHELHHACRARFIEGVLRLYGPRFTDEVLGERVREPVLAVRFEVEQIYVQTPGPAAGRRLYPPEEP